MRLILFRRIETENTVTVILYHSNSISLPCALYFTVSGENPGVSLTAALQRLNLLEESSAREEEESPGVIFPNNLQITNADCSHLSFGSFGSGAGASFPGSFSSPDPAGVLEVPSEKSEATSLDHSDSRLVLSVDLGLVIIIPASHI